MESSFFSAGTTQKDRTPEVLLPAYVNVEEKSISDFLNFVSNFAKIIQYWNTYNYKQGSFQEFFKDDLSFVLAEINTVDLNRYPLSYSALVKAFPQLALTSEKEQTLVELLLLNLDLSKLLESWYTKICKPTHSTNAPNPIEVMFREIIESNLWKDSVEFENFYKRIWMFFIQNPSKIAQRNLPTPVHYATLFYTEIFATAQQKRSSQSPAETSPFVLPSSYEGFFEFLQQLYLSLYAIVSLIQQSVPTFLNQSLQVPDHSPQVALLMAYWEMQQQTNQLLNQFTQKHLNYYYFDVLQQQQAASIPDQVLLSFKLNPTQTQNFIPQGTPFLAGASPSGAPLLYTSDADLTVNNASTVAFKTIYNGTIGASEFGTNPGCIYADPIANSGDGLGGKFTETPASWPSLGAAGSGPGDPTLARLGFALSNPSFFLSEGTRKLSIVLELSESSADMLKQELAHLNFPELSYWEILESLVSQSFSLLYTSPKGWEAPSEVHTWLLPYWSKSEQGATGKQAKLGIAFFITLSHTQPAMVAYSEKVHGAGFQTSAPIIQFTIAQSVEINYDNQGVSTQTTGAGVKQLVINPYSLLSKITIEKIPIYLDVTGVQDFVIQNDFSVLSPKKPFPPFGASPLANNHFYLGNNEIFRKQLSSLSLTIDWYDIPNLTNGFCEYYQDYNRFQPDHPFYNSVFKWKLDMLVSKNQNIDEIWKPLPFSFTPPKSPVVSPFSDPSNESNNNTSTKDPANNPPPESAAQPPQSLTPELAQKLLNELSQYYGEDWNKNPNPVTPANAAAGQLQVYQNTNIHGKPLIINTSFTTVLDTINSIAQQNKVTIVVTRSFMASALPLDDVVLPVYLPNNLVGHAVDFTLIYDEDKIADADYLSKRNQANWYPSVKGFIDGVNAANGLHWGGEATPENPGHIDDNLFKRDRQQWGSTYQAVQTEWKNHPIETKNRQEESGNTKHSDSNQPSIEEQLAKKILAMEDPDANGSSVSHQGPTGEKGLLPPQTLTPALAQRLLGQLSTYLGQNWKTNAKSFAASFNPDLGLDPPLTIFKGKQFQGKPLIADLDFLPVLHRVDELALENNVIILILDSFIPNSTSVSALSQPIKQPNHLIGHAFDFNLIYDEGKTTADADDLAPSNAANWAPAVKGFIEDLNSENGISWGGSQTPENPIQIDDQYYQQNPEGWKSKYTEIQTAWKARDSEGNLENSMFEWNPVATQNNANTPKHPTTPPADPSGNVPDPSTPPTSNQDHELFHELLDSLGTQLGDLTKDGALEKKLGDLAKDELKNKSGMSKVIDKVIAGAKGILGNDKSPDDNQAEGGGPAQGDVSNTPPTNHSTPATSQTTSIACPYKNEGTLKTQTQVEVYDFKSINSADLSTPVSFSPKAIYNDQSVDGFLRFTLTNPPYAFGGSAYPRIVAAVANYNMELIANKVEQAIGKGKEKTDLKALAKLGKMMPTILSFLNDPVLKVIEHLKAHQLQSLYTAAVTAATNANTIIGQGVTINNLATLEQQFVSIRNFLYPLGQLLSRLAGVAPEHHGLFKDIFNTFKGIFGHHSLLGGLGSILEGSIPFLGTIAKITKLIKPFLKKEKTAIAALLKNYNQSLQYTQTALTLIQKAMTDAGIPINSAKQPPANPGDQTSGKNDPTASTPGQSTPAANVPLLPPRPAYIPKISKLLANYKATDQIDLSPVQSSVSGNSSQFFHLRPFGISIPKNSGANVELLPKYAEEGYLYIALEKVNAPEIVTLLFIMNEGSGNRDAPPPKMNWSYLDQGNWTAFKDAAVKDGTNGFVQSGIISFNLPSLSPVPSALNGATTLFVAQTNASDYYWLRAAVAEHADAVCEIMNVYTQAVAASYASGDLDPGHFAAPLPKGTISKFQKPNPGITKILQPAPSFGGRADESEPQFYTRVNEQLRHKGRAVTSWDYERLILQEFPSISLARCLNHVSASNSIAPGSISVLILPQNITEPGNLLNPKTDQGKIKQVKKYLQGITDPLAKLDIRNPSYHYLQVELAFSISDGIDPGHTLNLLNQGLINEIAPWYSDYQNVNPFEVSNSYYSILEYIYSQSFVEEVFQMELTLLNTKRSTEGQSIAKSYDPIQAGQPWVIISSVSKHQLKIVDDATGMALSRQEKENSTEEDSAEANLPSIVPANNGSNPTKAKVLNALYIGNNLFKRRR